MIILKSVLLLILLNPFTPTLAPNPDHVKSGIQIREVKSNANIEVNFCFESLAEQIERDLYTQKAIATSA